MSDLLQFDLPSIIHEGLSNSKRAPDGLLHCSGDLVGSLRHTMLHAAGAPEKSNDLIADVILETGTLWHNHIHKLLVGAGIPFMQEIKVTPWLPKGWGGTADWLFWNPEYNAYVLGDLKTTAGEGIAFIERDGMKEAHRHQLSAYWYALANAGFPLLDTFVVCYFPKNRAKNYDTKPIMAEAKPLDEEYMSELMRSRRAAVDLFLEHAFEEWDEYIAPVQERELKAVWSRDHYDLKLVPHWSAQFCPYDNALCDCSEQGETKVGDYDLDGEGSVRYNYRNGYDHIDPIELTLSQRRKLGTS